MKNKNFVIIKHPEGHGKFLFYVPKRVQLEAGDKVVCETKMGPDQMGVCCCDSFIADPEVVCPLFGTQPMYMKYVTGKVEYILFEFEKDDEE